MQPRGADDARVLEIALRPAPVAHRHVDQRRRALLVRARQAMEHVHRPAGATDQGRLDEVVGKDVSTEGRLPGQVGQAAGIREGAGPDDRVVPPVVAVPTGPRGEAGRDHRTVDPGGELLEAGEQGVAVDDQRQRLDDAGIRVRLHGGGERHDRRSAHQTVGVQDEHVVVAAAPAGDEIADVACFAVMILRPVPVVEPGLGTEPAAQVEIGALLGDPGVGLGRDPTARTSRNGLRARWPRPPRAWPRSPRRCGPWPRCRLGIRTAVRVRSAVGSGVGRGRRRSVPKPQHRAGEGERDPREGQAEQDDQDELERGRAAGDRHGLDHLPAAVGRQGHGATEAPGAAPARASGPGGPVGARAPDPSAPGPEPAWTGAPRAAGGGRRRSRCRARTRRRSLAAGSSSRPIARGRPVLSCRDDGSGRPAKQPCLARPGLDRAGARGATRSRARFPDRVRTGSAGSYDRNTETVPGA